jgi:hypothetical protein
MPRKWVCVLAVLIMVAGAAAGQDKKRSEFRGKWSGNWENTRGENGTETLTLRESPEGHLAGVYWEDSKLKGERVGEHTFYFESRTDSHAYRVVGRIEGGTLILNYSATSPDGKDRYYGKSVLQRAR